MKNQFACPNCVQRGKPVKKMTLDSLLKEPEKQRILGKDASYAFCQSANCPVVYFDKSGDSVFEKDALTVRVGIKEIAAPRPICYCFDHTIEEIEEELARTGQTSVLDDIRTRMKDGCWCETKSPMGSCCLGMVSKFANAVKGDDDCCVVAPSKQSRSTEKAGVLATIGAVLSAILSSACCWLPLLLIGFGMSAAGVAGVFEAYRVWFLAATVLLLGVGFYLLYFRKPVCEAGSSCAVPNPKLQRFNRGMLWCATAMVAVFVAFPNVLGMLVAETDSEPMPPGLTAVMFEVEGMTCEGCATGLQKQIAAVDGVAYVRVDYSNSAAIAGTDKDVGRVSKAVATTIRDAGYRAAPTDLAQKRNPNPPPNPNSE